MPFTTSVPGAGAPSCARTALRFPRDCWKVNCSGTRRGAFTGALMQRKGRFELADGGSLFLDEIGDISLELQPKLLRAVQEQEFERLGSAKTISVNVRIIAATHRDLASMIREQRFREDLFYRLNVFPIEIPPLRERREDIPLLVNYFVSKFCRRMGRQISSIPKAAMEALTNNPWPGNVRELANFIERAVILSPGEELEVPMRELSVAYSHSASAQASTFEEAERQVIIEALSAASGRVAGSRGSRRTAWIEAHDPSAQNSSARHHGSSLSAVALDCS